MPGFNQRGPQGMGPMTGRGMGVCRNQNTQDPGAGAGYGAGFSGRGCRRGFAGGGRGRGMGRGFGASAAPGETSLQDRARMLEDELNAVKAQLNSLSEDK